MVIRVLLAEHNEGMRRIEESLLQAEPQIEVVGETVVGRQAIQLVKMLKPHVVVMDLNMTGDQGVSTREVKFEEPNVGVLAVAPLGRGALIRSYIRAFGADELLDESELGVKLVPTIKLIAMSARSS